jgi:hypothetical protein
MPTNIYLSLATFPVLVGLGVSFTLTKGIVELGRVSEEIFRGDRLPILPFPADVSSTQTQDN